VITVAGSIEWAKQLRQQLQDEIRTLARVRRGAGSLEALGLLPEQDHLQDLRRRLTQVERLIEAMSGSEPHAEAGWPADLGDPSMEAEPAKAETSRPM
jgi:hypothetical protein